MLQHPNFPLGELILRSQTLVADGERARCPSQEPPRFYGSQGLTLTLLMIDFKCRPI